MGEQGGASDFREGTPASNRPAEPVSQPAARGKAESNEAAPAPTIHEKSKRTTTTKKKANRSARVLCLAIKNKSTHTHAREPDRRDQRHHRAGNRWRQCWNVGDGVGRYSAAWRTGRQPPRGEHKTAKKGAGRAVVWRLFITLAATWMTPAAMSRRWQTRTRTRGRAMQDARRPPQDVRGTARGLAQHPQASTHTLPRRKPRHGKPPADGHRDAIVALGSLSPELRAALFVPSASRGSSCVVMCALLRHQLQQKRPRKLIPTGQPSTPRPASSM